MSSYELLMALPLRSKVAEWKWELHLDPEDTRYVEWWWDRGEYFIIASFAPGDDSTLEVRAIPREEIVDYMRASIQNDWELIEGELLPGVSYKED